MMGRFAAALVVFAFFCFCHDARGKSVSRNGGTPRSVPAMCRQSPVQVVVLVDISADNDTVFQVQQERVIATIQRIANLTSPATFGIVAFHQLPIVLQPLGSPFSNVEKTIELIENLRPRPRMDSSPAKALAMASKQILKHGKAGARTVVLMAHSGHSMDLIPETLEASSNLRRQDATIVAVVGVEHPNIPALLGYTGNRGRIYFHWSDQQRFFAELDEIVAACVIIDSDANFANLLAEKSLKNVSRASFDIKSRATGENRGANKFPKDACEFNKVDLIIVLDTSASVFSAFKEERGFASDLIKALHPDAFSKGLQVAAVRFAAAASVAIPFQVGRSKGEILERMHGIQFTGSHTRIANAIDVALGELRRARRPDAKQVLVLLSDGHGQEFWSQVQASGLKLQMANAELFAATTSRDYNLGELTLYTGDESRVFVGARQATFIPTVTKYISTCLQGTDASPLGGKASGELPPKADAMPILDEGTDKIVEGAEKAITKTNENASGDSVEDISKQESKETRTVTEMRGISFSKDATACAMDLVLIIDRSASIEDEFGKQLAFAVDLVDRVMDDDLTAMTVRVGVISFSSDANIDIPLGKLRSRSEIIQHLKGIRYMKSQTSTVAGVKKAVEEISMKRRPDAHLMIVLISDGNSKDEWSKIQEAAIALHELNGAVYAVTSGRTYVFAELEAFAGDKWRVFTDARQRHFVEKVSDELSSCKKTVKEVKEVKQSGPSNCEQDHLDLVMILDLSTNLPEEFDKEKQFAIDLIRQSPVNDYMNRTRVALVTFSELGKLEFGLTTTTAQDDLLYALERIERTGGQTSVVSGIDRAVLEITAHRRPLARLVVLLITDGHSREKFEEIELAAVRLHATAADIYVVTMSKQPMTAELKEYAGSDGHVFINGREKRFLAEVTVPIFGCSWDGTDDSSTSTGFTKTTKAARISPETKSMGDSKPKDSPLEKANAVGVEEIGSETKKTEEKDKSENNKQPEKSAQFDNTASKIESKTQTALNNTSHISDEQPIFVPMSAADCKVDLIFIIDRSQSVEKDFQQQLMFAVNLVKRLPSTDFEHRVHVAAVSFNLQARVDFPFGKLKNREAVIDALLKIDHTGGSTSSVSGVNLAVDEIIRGRRRDTRVMAVLISDGNSQDHWEHVLAASARLRATNADVRAITVSHEYFFRELEMYAGNKWLVYIDARIRQFLDEAEHSLMNCQGPAVPSSNDVVLEKRLTTIPPTIPTTTTTSTTTTTTTTTTAAATTSSTSTTTPATTTSASTTPTTTSSTTIARTTQAAAVDCEKDIVDLVILLDTSTSVEKEFYAEKNFALDLIKMMPEDEFSKRISVALVRFAGDAMLQFGFGTLPNRNDVLYELERVEHSGGQTSLAAAVKLALEKVITRRRPDSRLVVVIISDGNSQDQWQTVQHTAKKLRDTGGEIYAITLSENFFLDELKEYTSNSEHVYFGQKIVQFVQDVGTSVVTCPGKPAIHLTAPPMIEVTVTPPPEIK